MLLRNIPEVYLMFHYLISTSISNLSDTVQKNILAGVIYLKWECSDDTVLVIKPWNYC